MNWKEFYNKVRRGRIAPPVLLGIDPGGEIGWSVFTDGELAKAGQTPGYVHKTGEIHWEGIEQLLSNVNPTHIVCEDYKVYAHKLEQHTFSSVPTLRIIGMIEYWAWKNNVPIHYQMAMQAKGFCTDDKLKKWELWQKGQRHSRDAIRHICYFLTFERNYN